MEKTHGVNIPQKDLSPSDAVIRKAKWAAMKEEFIELTITGQGVHWPTLADKYGFTAETARNKASLNKWYAEIETRRKDREDILDDKLTARTTMALDVLNRDFATNEAAIRKRHAVMARGLQGRAITRLKEMKLTDFSARDALTMLKLGIDEERFAMGMPQTFGGAKEEPVDSAFRPLVEQIGGHKRVQRIGMILLEALKGVSVDKDMILESGLAPEDVQPLYKPVPEAVAFGVSEPPVPGSNVKIKKASHENQS